ncbi:MAG: amino acid-binding protein [Oscillospiraceae bacterium]|jgi:hypothetical protein|nr:amino acid-binding protein [Oscillospiraceae bacterium]
MVLKQLSIFVENRPGAIAEPLGVLLEAGVNAVAFTVADTTDFGIIRMIVDDTDKAVRGLKNSGFTVNVSDVLGLTLEDKPGAFYHALKELSDANVNIEYSYAFCGPKTGEVTAVLRVPDINSVEFILK